MIPGDRTAKRGPFQLQELTDEEFTALEDALNGLKVYGHRGLGGF